MKKCILLVIFLLLPAVSGAKMKMVQKPAKDYDFKSVQKVVVLPMTSDNVDFGKVDKDRLPKIKAMLEKAKKNLRDNMLVGSKEAKTTIPFAGKSDNKPTTLVMKYNFDQFDNGNFVARAIPFAGKAKVKLNVKFYDGKQKRLLAEMEAEGKAQGGAVVGGLDSEVLWTATNIANAETYKFLKKYAGLDYSFFAGMTSGKNIKQGFKSNVDIIKEEKKEKNVVEKKTKKKR